VTCSLRLVAGVGVIAVAAAASGCSRQSSREDPIAIAARSTEQADLGRTAADGRRRFLAYCAPCHGDEGRGDGQNASRLTPRPTDLRGAAARLSAADIRRIVDAGTAATGRSPLCPPLGRTLGAEGVDAVVAYVQTLRR